MAVEGRGEGGGSEIDMRCHISYLQRFHRLRGSPKVESIYDSLRHGRRRLASHPHHHSGVSQEAGIPRIDTLTRVKIFNVFQASVHVNTVHLAKISPTASHQEASVCSSHNRLFSLWSINWAGASSRQQREDTACLLLGASPRAGSHPRNSETLVRLKRGHENLLLSSVRT